MVAPLVIPHSRDEAVALSLAGNICDAALLTAPPEMSNHELQFKNILRLQLAGYILRSGDELPREQWLATNLGMSAIEFEVEGWNALLANKYRVAFVLLRPVLESALYVMACAAIQGFVDRWFAGKLGFGTVREIREALRPKLGDQWTDSLKKKWDLLNELAHTNLFPNASAWLRTKVESGREAPGLPLFGPVFDEQTAVFIAVLYADVSRDLLVAESATTVVPRESYPEWHKWLDSLLAAEGLA